MLSTSAEAPRAQALLDARRDAGCDEPLPGVAQIHLVSQTCRAVGSDCDPAVITQGTLALTAGAVILVHSAPARALYLIPHLIVYPCVLAGDPDAYPWDPDTFPWSEGLPTTVPVALLVVAWAMVCARERLQRQQWLSATKELEAAREKQAVLERVILARDPAVAEDAGRRELQGRDVRVSDRGQLRLRDRAQELRRGGGCGVQGLEGLRPAAAARRDRGSAPQSRRRRRRGDDLRRGAQAQKPVQEPLCRRGAGGGAPPRAGAKVRAEEFSRATATVLADSEDKTSSGVRSLQLAMLPLRNDVAARLRTRD